MLRRLFESLPRAKFNAEGSNDPKPPPTKTASGVAPVATGGQPCYAKAINFTPESEPDIFQALRFGAVLENVVLDEDHDVDYTDTSITENTRGAYPIEFIQNTKIPCIAGHPTDVIFLTCDAFGVLPPVSALS